MATEVISKRLLNQHLEGNKFEKPEEVVRHLGGVQAQDFAAAKWSLGIRLENSSNDEIESAYNDGKFLRTHIMRPTWHFVMPEDLVWIQKLTSGNVKRLMNHYNRKLELTPELLKKTEKVIKTGLMNENYLTRQEIKTLLTEIGVETNVQRLAHIVMWAELDAMICSGPLKGKQFTYGLTEQRVPKNKILSREESLAKLALKYYKSHGPAQLKDFSWWSGLSVKDSLEALSMIKSKLIHQTINNKDYWSSLSGSKAFDRRQTAFLLSIYDEYTIAYKDRTDLSEGNYIEKMISMGNALTAVIILNGKVAGTWKRKLSKKSVEVQLKLFRKITKPEKIALHTTVQNYSKFLKLPVQLTL